MEKVKKIHPIEGQSLLDIALQESGDLSGVASLSKENGLLFSSVLSPNEELHKGKVADAMITQYYQQRRIQPVTGILAQDVNDGGIFGAEFDDYFE